MKPKKFHLFFLLAAASSVSFVHALTWDPTNVPTAPVGGAGIWDATTTTNWSDGAVDSTWGNSPTAVAVFTGTLGGTVTVGTGGISVNAFNFTNTIASYTFSGAPIALIGTTPTITTTGTGNVRSITVPNATIGSSVTGATLNTAGTGVVGLSNSAITGTLTIGNTSALILTGTNTAGSVAVGSNVLAIGSNTALASGTAIAASTGSFVLLANGVTTQASLTFSGGNGNLQLGNGANWKGNLIHTNANDISVNANATGATISGNITMSAGGRLFFRNDQGVNPSALYNTTTSGTGTITVTGTISGANTLNVGTTANTTTVTMTGTNTFTGATTVGNGWVIINSIKNVGGASSLGAPITVANGTIAVGSAATSGTLNYIGSGDTTDRVVNLAGTTGASVLDQSGAGLLKFTSAFTATGAGIKTLTLQGATVGTGEIAGAIVDNSGTNKTAVTKAGTGTWTLSGANTYTGATTINGGTLNISNSLTSAVTVNTTGTLGGGGTTTGVVTLNNGSSISGGAATGVGLAATNAFKTSSTLTTAATVAIVGSDDVGAIGLHTIDAIQYTGTDPLVGNFSAASYHSGAVVTTGVAAGGANKKVTLAYTSAQRSWNSASGLWDTMVTSNWQEEDQKFGVGDVVIFDDTGVGGGAARSVTLNTVATPGSVIFNNTIGDYSVTGTGSITGLTGLTKSGTGTVTLGTANTFTGQTNLTAGTLTLANSGALQNSTLNRTGGILIFDSSVTSNAFALGGLSGSQDIALQNNAGSPAAIVLSVGNNNGSTSFSGVLSGAGSLTKTGTGVLTLFGTSTYTGKTFLNGGVTQISSDGNFGTAPEAAVADQLTFGGGTLQFGAPVTLAANRGVKLNAGTTFDTNGSAVTIDGIVTGTGSVTKSGAGTLSLTRANTYSGNTTILAGTLQVGNASSTNNKVTTLNGGNLTLVSGVTYNIDSGLTFASNTNATVSAASGTASVQGFDTNSADIIVNTGVTAAIDASVGLKTGTFGIRIDNTGDLAAAGVVSGSGSDTGFNMIGQYTGTDRGALYKLGTGTLTFTGVSTFTSSGVPVSSVQNGTLKLSGGDNRLPATSGIYLGQGTTSGKLVLDGINQTVTGLKNVGTGTGNAVVGGNATRSTLTVNNTNNYTFAGAIGGAGTNENNLALVKSGAGTLTLSGANTYTGSTTVNGGTLSLGTASLADAFSVTIASGASLELTHGTTDTVDSLFVGGIQLAAGLYKSSTGAGEGTVLASLIGEGKLEVINDSSDTFAGWMSGYDFSALPDTDLTATGDADQDGIENVIEHVFGTAPNAPTTGITQIAATATSVTFQHPFNPDLGSDVACSYQWSSDLSEWKSSGQTNTGGTTASLSAGAPAAGIVTVTGTISAGPSTKLFVRIVATQTP